MPTRTSKPAAPSEGIRDTLDSIIIAFILAFVFRAFVVEAFVIPTGSMAPTLYGAHGHHRCSNCGYHFAYGLREDAVRTAYNVVCPNCNNFKDFVEGDDLPFLADNGDRILVMKWPFDVGGEWLGPRRWDVIVFKDPKDGKQNFIKRLVGMPGEVFEIIDGDIYAAPASELPPALTEKLLKDPLTPGGRHLSEADFHELDKHLRIQRKTDSAQSVLWMIHYDHDYLPLVPMEDGPRWSARGNPNETGWDVSTPVITFDGRSGAARSLELTGKPITDLYGYNKEMLAAGGVRQLRYVTDIRVSGVVVPRGSTGSISFLLSKRQDEFRATIDADGHVSLAHHKLGASAPFRDLTRAKIDALRTDRPVVVDFQIVDYRVRVRIDDADVAVTTDDQFHPDLGWLRRRHDGDGPPSRVSISATGLPLEIRHLAVHRDIHYRSVDHETGGPDDRNPYLAAGIPAWGTAGNPIFLREGEFFACGDNSPASKDSRLWWETGDFVDRRGDAYQRGTIPADQLIGRAFFVYWPAGYRLGQRGLPVIPNVGRMRVIR
ncbi:MAG: S26 family signal peptidase [Phycisphaerae bacterium]|nr:S26 family signal peptidase [Phycisphaerae bacterium]